MSKQMRIIFISNEIKIFRRLPTVILFMVLVIGPYWTISTVLTFHLLRYLITFGKSYIASS